MAVSVRGVRIIKHLGDIQKIDGSAIEKVDCITFGSPCQDISIAGKRKGMLHEDMGDDETTRSGLFYEAVRIIKEMREDDINDGRATDSARPRYAVYENVPGALSSNKGEDFRCVLEALAQVIQEDVCIPRFEGGVATQRKHHPGQRIDCLETTRCTVLRSATA